MVGPALDLNSLVLSICMFGGYLILHFIVNKIFVSILYEVKETNCIYGLNLFTHCVILFVTQRIFFDYVALFKFIKCFLEIR